MVSRSDTWHAPPIINSILANFVANQCNWRFKKAGGQVNAMIHAAGMKYLLLLSIFFAHFLVIFSGPTYYYLYLQYCVFPQKLRASRSGMKGIKFVDEKGLNWLEQETKNIYGTASKIGSCFPVRLDPKSEFTVQQGVEWILHTLTPTCNSNIPGTIDSTSPELHTQLQSTYEELFNTFTQV